MVNIFKFVRILNTIPKTFCKSKPKHAPTINSACYSGHSLPINLLGAQH